MKIQAKNVNEYIEAFSQPIQDLLKQMRETILRTAPKAQESISYAMPAYKINGKPLVYFAGFKNHIGFYATPTGHKEFETELANYKQGKGSVQFPLDEPLPFELISKIVKYRVKLNESE
jgi:uncharacterized protein YdhG (YjbR/CyaY superfamily)